MLNAVHLVALNPNSSEDAIELHRQRELCGWHSEYVRTVRANSELDLTDMYRSTCG